MHMFLWFPSFNFGLLFKMLGPMVCNLVGHGSVWVLLISFPFLSRCPNDAWGGVPFQIFYVLGTTRTLIRLLVLWRFKSFQIGKSHLDRRSLTVSHLQAQLLEVWDLCRSGTSVHVNSPVTNLATLWCAEICTIWWMPTIAYRSFAACSNLQLIH